MPEKKDEGKKRELSPLKKARANLEAAFAAKGVDVKVKLTRDVDAVTYDVHFIEDGEPTPFALGVSNVQARRAMQSYERGFHHGFTVGLDRGMNPPQDDDGDLSP